MSLLEKSKIGELNKILPVEKNKDLTPEEIVKIIDKYVVGQEDAKRMVAIALRNRYRRQQLPPELRDEVAPKNIIMIGPTGVGKTEIARRLAKLTRAPFIKVEATKYTEVGYVGRDVESMIRDLIDLAVNMVKTEKVKELDEKARGPAEERLLDLLLPISRPRGVPALGESGELSNSPDERLRLQNTREKLRQQLREGKLEGRMVEVELKEKFTPMLEIFTGTGIESMDINLPEALGGFFPPRSKRRRVTVSEARKILLHEEIQKLIDMDEVIAEAIRRLENSGIVFIDEIDKIAGRERGVGPDVSREGVQRDILPIVEGTTVVSKYGMVKTDHILFIAAGAFHITKPSDLIPELQGRFPLRVELKPLTEEDFKRILTTPENALVKQYIALLKTEGVDLEFTPDAIEEMAHLAYLVNEQTENIGARRLHTIMEKVLEEISFHAPSMEGKRVVVDARYVRERLAPIIKNEDLTRYIL